MSDTNLSRAARSFLDSGFHLEEGGADRANPEAYAFESDRVWYVLDAERRNVSQMTISKFVGSVAYALAAEGKLADYEATPDRVAELCYYIGRVQQAEVDARPVLISPPGFVAHA